MLYSILLDDGLFIILPAKNLDDLFAFMAFEFPDCNSFKILFAELA